MSSRAPDQESEGGVEGDVRHVHRVFDMSNHPLLDRYARLAASVFDCPMAVICIALGSHFWLKARHGIELEQIERSHDTDVSMLVPPKLLVIEDVRSDTHYADEPFVRHLPSVRFLAAVPLLTDKGSAFGSLCVCDARPRVPSAHQLHSLEQLAQIVTDELMLPEAGTPGETDTSILHKLEGFSELADALPILVWSASPDGVVNYFGQPLIEYTGIAANLHREPGRWIEVVHPDDRGGCISAWLHSVATGEDYSYQFRLRRIDGVYRWFAVQAVPARDADGRVTGWIGSATDIDQQVRLQHELRSRGEHFSAIFESIPDPCFAIDDDGQLEFANTAAQRLFAQHEAIIGMPVWEAFTQLSRTRVALECRVARQRGRVVRFETFLDFLAQWFDVCIFPTVKGLCIFIRNIDTRMRDGLMHSAEARVLSLIAAGESLPVILNQMVLGVEAVLPDMRASVLLVDNAEGVLRQGASPSLPDAYNEIIDGLRVGPAVGSCGTCAYRKEAVIVGDIETDPLWADYADIALGHGLHACWSMPVFGRDDEVIATFGMYYLQPRLPEENELELISRMVQLVSIALTRTREHQALRASEERFRSLFRDAAVGIVLSEPSGAIVDANRSFCELLGYEIEQLRGRSVRELTHPEDREENSRYLDQLLDGSRRSFIHEKRYVTRTGESVWVRVSVAAQVEDGKVLRLMGVSEDINQQHLAEVELRRQSALLAMASRLGRIGGWMIEMPEKKVTWSEEIYRILEAPEGFQPDLEADALALYRPEYRDEVRQAVLDCTLHGKSIDMEADLQTLGGQPIRFRILGEAVRDEGGSILSVNGAVQDITERHRLLKNLAESEERFRQIAESVDDVFWMATADRQSILYISPAYERIWQRRLHHLYESPQSWIDSILDEDRPLVRQANELNLSEGRTVEYRIRRPDGSVRSILDRAFPVFDANGEVVRIVGVARDVTEQKIAEKNLLDALEQVQRSNRELEDFAYVASHDLQEPLRKIKVFSDRLDARSEALDEKERDYLARISRAAERMQTLIRDLLGYSRVATRAEAMRQVSLDQILTDVLNDLEIAIGDGQASIERSPLPVITGDPRQLQQLLQNLLENAIKFHRPGVPSRIRVFSRSERKSVQICVEDNGIGIEEEFVERIFRPFQRLHGKGEYPGSGIGLAIVKKIADRHGAQIEVRPTLGGGATFCVVFPRAGG